MSRYFRVPQRVPATFRTLAAQISEMYDEAHLSKGKRVNARRWPYQKQTMSVQSLALVSLHGSPNPGPHLGKLDPC